jgi:hypothetical protein
VNTLWWKEWINALEYKSCFFSILWGNLVGNVNNPAIGVDRQYDALHYTYISAFITEIGDEGNYSLRMHCSYGEEGFRTGLAV